MRFHSRFAACFFAALVLGGLLFSAAQAVTINYDFNTSLQGWTQVMGDNSYGYRQVTGTAGAGQGTTAQAGGGFVNALPEGGRDVVTQTTIWLRSPEFVLDNSGALSFYLQGGANGTLPANASLVPTTSSGVGAQGIALRRVNDGAFVLTKKKGASGATWESLNFSISDLASYVGGTYTLDLIDYYGGGWGWIALDTVAIPGTLNASTWAGATDSDWGNAANWNVAPAPGASVVLGNTGANATVNLVSAGATVSNLKFLGTVGTTLGGANTLTMNNGTSWAPLNVSGGTNTINANMSLSSNTLIDVAASSKLTIGGNIGGAAGMGILKTGTGLLVLGGTNNYSGTTTISGGTLQVSADSALGQAPGSPATNIIFQSNDTGTITNSTLQWGAAFNIDPNRSIWAAPSAQVYLDTQAFNVALGSSITVNTRANGTVGAVPTVTKLGSGTLTISGGTSNISYLNVNAGTLAFTGGIVATNRLSRPGGSSSNVVFNGGTLKVMDSGVQSPWIRNSVTNYYVNAGGAIFDTNGRTAVVDKTLQHDASGPATDGGLTKNGSGTLRVQQSMTFTGPYNINAGILQLNDTNTFSSASGFNIAAGGRWDMDFGGTTIAKPITLNGNLAATDEPIWTDNGGTYVFSDTLTLNALSNMTSRRASDTKYQFTGQVTGAGGLQIIRSAQTGTQTGPWIELNNATNNYGGETIVNAGRLLLGAAGALPSTTTLRVGGTPTSISGPGGDDNQGPRVELQGFSQTVAGLGDQSNRYGQIGNTSGTAVTLAVNNAASNSFGGSVHGNLALSKGSAGTLTLNNINTYANGTTISNGILEAGNTGALGSGAVTLAGGTLSLTSNAGPLAVTGFNQDLVYSVADTGDADNGTTIAFNNTGNRVFYESTTTGTQRNNTQGGLPNSRVINGTGGVSFRMEPYGSLGANNNNALFLDSTTPSGTITLTDPGKFQTVNVMQTGNGTTNFTYTLNYADSTSTTASYTSANGWDDNEAGCIARGLRRIDRQDSGSFGGSNDDPHFFQLDISPDPTKVLNSITFTKTSGTELGVFAASGTLAGGATAVYGNNLSVTANSTVNVGTAGGARMGTLSIGSNQLGLTGGNLTLGAAAVTGNATFDTAGGTILTLGAVDGGGAARTITASGSGTTKLTDGGANLAAGSAFNVTGGTLASSHATGVGGAAVNVSAGAGFAPLVSQTVGDLASAGSLPVGGVSLTAGNISLTNGGSIGINLANPPSNPANGVISGADLSATGTTTLNLSLLSTLGTGYYPLINYSGSFATGGAGNFATTGLPANTRKSYVLDAGTGTNSMLSLNVSGGPGNVTWAGDGTANVWNVNGVANWAGPEKFYNEDNASFTDSGDNAVPIDLQGTLLPGTVTVNASKDYVFAGSGSIGGVASLTKAGNGKLTITNENSYSGGTTVSAGTLQIGSGGAAGSIAGNVTVDGNLAFNRSDNPYTFNGTITGGGTVEQIGPGTLLLGAANSHSGGTIIDDGGIILGNAAALGNGPLTMYGGALDIAGFNPVIIGLQGSGGVITTTVAGTRIVTTAPLTTSDFSGAIADNGPGKVLGLVKQDVGVQVLSGANSYSGGTTISNGTLRLNNSLALGSATGNLAVNATLDLYGQSPSVGAWSGSSAGVLTTTMAGPAYLYAASSGNSTYSGAINDGAGQVGIYKDGSGTLTLAGACSNTGLTTVANGTLQIGGGGAGASYAGNITNQAAVVLNNSDAWTYSGVISGLGSLEKKGTGTVTLGAQQAHGNGTTVSGGTLKNGLLNALPPDQPLTVAGSGATYDLDGHHQTVIALNGGGATSGTVTNSNLGTPAVLTVATPVSTGPVYGGRITGNLKLYKDDLGSQTISGANTYTQGTEVKSGTLIVKNSSALGDAAGRVAMTGGTLSLQTLALSAGQQTLAVTGFNQDVIWGLGETNALVGSTASIANSNPGNALWEYSASRNGGTGGLPSNGLLGPSNVHPGVYFQLAGYDSTNNALLIDATNTTGTLQLAAPSPLSQLQIMAFPGETYGAYDLQVNFDDGTWKTVTNLNMQDSNNGGAPYVVRSIGVKDRTTQNGWVYMWTGTESAMRENDVDFTTEEQAKKVVSLSFTRTSGHPAIMGISGAVLGDALQSYANGVDVTVDSTIDVPNGIAAQMGSLTIGAQTLYVTGNATLTMGATTLGGNASFNVASSMEARLGAVGETGGSRNLTKLGDGTLGLNEAGTFTGHAVPQEGTLAVRHASALQAAVLEMNPGDTGSVTFPGLAQATLGGLTGSRDLTLPDSFALSVGANNADSTYSGSLGGTGAKLVKVGSAKLTLAAASAYTGGVTANAGTLQLGHEDAIPIPAATTGQDLHVGDAAQVVLNVGLPKAVQVKGLTMYGGPSAPTGTVDLKNGQLVIDGTVTPVADVTALVAKGYNLDDPDNPWTGPGITSSTAAASAAKYAVGYALNSDYGELAWTTWFSRDVNNDSVLVRFTYQGDCDLSGEVTTDDFDNWKQGYITHGSGWLHGDLDYSGEISTDDFDLWKQVYVKHYAPLPTGEGGALRSAAVPEPGTLALLALAGLGLLFRRRASRGARLR